MERELNEAETNLRLKMADHARRLTIESGLDDPGDSPLSPRILDHLWQSWDWNDQLGQSDQRIAIAFFGFALGEYIAQETGLRWCIVADQAGDDYALIGPKAVTTFPLAIVAKRYAGPPFFSALIPQLIRDIESPPKASKPWWKVW